MLTVAKAHLVAFQGLSFSFRQALEVDATGVVAVASVRSAVIGGSVTAAGARGIRIASTGEAFNGVYVSAGTYSLQQPKIAFTGNGRCDFIGHGAAVVGTGTGTALTVEDATITAKGVVRTAVIADGGANVVVKNSKIQVANGVLPSGYVSTVDTSLMEDAPWMLGISGNCRATNLLGTGTRASYVNSSVFSEGWGALSVDNGQNSHLTAINCRVGNTGADGYGSYAIGDATEYFLGCDLNVGTYASINRGGVIHYGDSARADVANLNSALGIGLTAQELAALPVRNTVINSRRFGFMWHGAGSLVINGGTVVNTEQTMFLDKGQQIAITVDGSKGVQLNPGNGVLLQVMENDDPGPVMVGGKLVNQGVYTEPTGTPARITYFDVATAHPTDAVANFADIALKGNFFNAMRGGQNLVLTFERSRVEGVISASRSQHAVSTITAAEYRQLGEVVNTPQPAVNNGVLVTVGAGSRWTVTGTSYLTKLFVAAGGSVTGADGRSLTLTVDGTATRLVPGKTYTGAIVLSVS